MASLVPTPGPAGDSLAASQGRFGDLVREVAAWRALVAEWEQRMDRFDQAVEPVRRELHAAWRQWVFALDAASLQPAFSRGERTQLGTLACDTARELLEVEADDAEIAALLQRHETPVQASPAEAGTTEDTEEPLHWEAQAEAAAAQRQQRAAGRRAAQQRKRRAEGAQEASQSVRDVYRKLASVLHPDRETDAQQRQRKTVLMQKANEAYAQGNLLRLLELQGDSEEVTIANVAALDDRRLQHYTTVLREQLAQLQSEVRRLEASLRAAAGLPPGTGLQARKADRLITAEARRMREDLQWLRAQTRMLLDVEATRDWLRQARRG